ncbi:MAG: hypothetical protein OXU51_00845 [Candidatus Poribacteria bacterium]|nr:hypothetical protein [Candidatus Poribacteria bacterium]
MQERHTLFTLDQQRFHNILSEENWFKLQHEFKTKKNPLSQSLLIWDEEPGKTWLLADFGNQKTYHIQNGQAEEENLITDAESNPVTHVSELSDLDNQPVTLKDTETILSRLQQDPQTGQEPKGTHRGFIDLLKKLDLDEIDLEELKRSNLSGSGLSFESVHPDLLVVYEMFREILTFPREDLVNSAHAEVQNVRHYLPQFYEIAQKIRDFDINVEKPSETHANLLQEISDFCGSVKGPLSQTISYLKSKQVEQLESQINATVADAEKNFGAEVNRAKEINNTAEAKEADRQKEFNRLKLELENQLAKKSISSYEKIFADQGDEHQKGARLWLITTGALTLVFGLIFWLLIKDLVPADLVPKESQVPMILQNLFTKGFFLSLIYLLLHRSIKNYTAEKHLETVNRHRQNALATFEAFTEAAGENRETRDAVLLAATDAIFDANQSGYLSVKTSRSDSAGPIQQVVRAVTPGKPPTGGD